MISVDEASSELPSSLHAVVSNDDLFIEILLRLPVVTLCVFKSVSKRWLTLITNPSFTLRRNQSSILDPPSGLFLRLHSSFKYDFVPLDIKSPAKRSPLPTTFTLDSDSGKIKILQSCNGLLLCGRIKPDEFCVYNPFINRFKTIHKSPLHRHDPKWIGSIDNGSRMAFDPSKSPHYKIVYAGVKEDDHACSLQIQIYSSETCNWSICGDRFPVRVFRGFNKGIYWNGAIHWLDTGNRHLHYKLDVEYLFLTSIQTPGTVDDSQGHRDQKLFTSRGCLILLCTGSINSIQLSIYVMRKWSSGWSLKYILDLDDIMIKFPKTWRQSPKLFCSSLLCIMIGEKDEDSFLVMEIYGKIVQYKIVSTAISKLYELKSLRSSISFEVIASFAGV